MQRRIASQCQGVCRFAARDGLGTWGVVSCYVPRAACSFAFGELAHIEVLAFCGFVARDCLAESGGMQICGAGLPRSVRGVCRLVAREVLGTWGVRAMYRAAAVKLSWKKAKGYKVDAYEVYRANAKNGKYVKLYTTKNAKKRSFTNGRNLQAGKTYYYKVRGVRTVDGKKYYTKWSNISAKKTR